MHINKLQLKNFRNFENAEFKFKEGVNTILGENSSGKTNALFALRLLLDQSLPRNSTNLLESDFCRRLESWKGHWIVISVDFANLAFTEGCQILKHLSAHIGSDDNDGNLTFYFRPSLKVRQSLHEASGDRAKIDELLNQISIDDYEPIFRGRASADFTDDETYKQLVGDFERSIFPDPTDENFDAYGIKIISLNEEVSFTFVKALRDVISDLKNYKNSPLIQVLKSVESDIDELDAAEIAGLVDGLNHTISNLDVIRDVSSGVQTTLHNTVGHTFSPIVSIESSLSGEMDKLLYKLSLKVGDNYADGYSGDLNELSLGGANLIYLALKLLEYEKKSAEDKVAQFLVIEEPEAHIHTHIQKTLFDNHAVGKTQVFLSTHSTHISSVAEISDMNILGIKDGKIDVFQPSNGLDPIQCSRIERYLNATRSTLLFAKGVMLVEGAAELILIPELVKKVLGVSLDELGISLISMETAFFEHLSTLFHKDRIRKNCSIITDLDSSIVPLPEDPSQDSKTEENCRNSQEVGANRKKLLDESIKDNDFVAAFYAKHTFEVDFITDGNEYEVESILDKIYKRSSNISNSKAKLKSPNLETYGTEVLRLANKEGKGWFSLLLTEALSSQTFIPEYILNAISFACKGNVSLSTLYKMCHYRITNPSPIEIDQTALKEFFDDNRNDKKACVDKFVESAEDDDLTLLITLLRT